MFCFCREWPQESILQRWNSSSPLSLGLPTIRVSSAQIPTHQNPNAQFCFMLQLCFPDKPNWFSQLNLLSLTPTCLRNQTITICKKSDYGQEAPNWNPNLDPEGVSGQTYSSSTALLQRANHCPPPNRRQIERDCHTSRNQKPRGWKQTQRT